MDIPTCFISYSWESEDHKKWIREFASELQDKGVHVFLDQWDLKVGSDLTSYMESSIRKADFVLLICTPSFAKKADEGKGGVGYEKSIVTGEIFTKSTDEVKFVPILKNGNEKESLPSYLKSRIFLDFRENYLFQPSFTELLRHIFKSPEFERPPLGKKPNLNNASVRSAVANKNGLIQATYTDKEFFNLEKFKELVGYASKERFLGGLGYTKDDAVAWAQSNMNLDLAQFKGLVEYASKEHFLGGLGYSKDDAVAWAMSKF